MKDHHSNEYYKNLLEIKHFENDTILEPSKQLLKASGILYQLLKEIENYGIKSGKNERYKVSLSRVLDLDNVVSKFSAINDINYQLRTLLKNSMLDRDRLVKENEKLKLDIEKIKNGL